MKIVYVDETFHPAYGYQSNPLAKFQQKQGNEIVIVTVDKEHIHPVYRAFGDTGESVDVDDKCYQDETGVKIVRVKTKGYFMHRAVLTHAVFEVVRDQKPDVVFIHCVETLTAMRFLIHKKEWPMMFDSHMLSMASQSRLVGAFETFYRMFFRRIIEKNHYFVVRTQNDDYVNKHLGINTQLTPFISFGTDTLLFYPSEEKRKEFRDDYSIDQDDFVVIYTGKLTEAKGGKLLAETFKNKFERPTVLVCVGSPPNDEYGKVVKTILESSENRIIMFPTQKYTDLAKFYQMADLSIFPKQCSMSFYDAQACGLPVLSESNNVNCDRCSHGNGDNFSPGDIQDFREKIVRFANMSKEEIDKFRNASIDYIRGGFDYAAIAQEYTKYLLKSIENFNS